MLLVPLLLLVLLVLQAGAWGDLDNQCPQECQCWREGLDRHLVSCLIDRSIDFVAKVSSSTTHLLIKLPVPSTKEFAKKKLYPNFNHLYRLRVLLFDNENPVIFSLTYCIEIERDSLSNCSSLTTVASTANIWYDPYAFVNNSLLTYLHMENTAMNWHDIANVSSKSWTGLSNLRTLQINYLGLLATFEETAIFSVKQYFGTLSHIRIERLNLSNNGIHTLKNEFQTTFPNLQYLDASYNMLTYPTGLDKTVFPAGLITSVPCLEFSKQGYYRHRTEGLIFDDYNEISYQRKTCEPSREQQSQLPTVQLPSLAECWNRMHIPLFSIESFQWSDLALPPADYNSELFVRTNICFATPNKLVYFDASHNSEWMRKFENITSKIMVYGFDQIQTLNIQYCGLNDFSYNMFNVMRSLRKLLMGGNNLGRFIKMWNFDMDNATHLEVLDLSYNDISHIPLNSSLHSMTSLVHVNLSGNSIDTWTVNVSRLIHLQTLNLSENALSSLSESTQRDLEELCRKQTIYSNVSSVVLDLSENPLSCICSDIQFVSWFKATSVGFHNKNSYTCTHPSLGVMSMNSIDLDELKNYCYAGRIKTIVLSSTMSVLSTAVISALIALYCRRWHLRYWWYVTQKGWQRLQRSHDEHDEYDYDVFVAHSQEDAEWVLGPLLDELETKHGLRLCLYERDIQPGEVLAEAICDRIGRSRFTLLVLSPSFVESNWCIFELHIAQTQLAEHGKDVIASVILRPLPEVAMHETLFKVLMRKVYLEWTENEVGQKLFWVKLAKVLGAEVESHEHLHQPLMETR